MRIESKVGASVAVLGSLLLVASGAVPALARSGPSAGPRAPGTLRFANAADAASSAIGG